MSSLLLTGAGPTGAGTAFDPLSLSPEMWLKADALGLSDGTSVGTWTDSSGNSVNATQATASLQPIFHTGILNGLPGVQFDGVDDEMTAATGAKTARTLSIVMKSTADTSGRNLFAWGSTSRARIKGTGLGYEWVNDQAAAVQAIGGSISTTAQLLTMKVVSASSIVFYANTVQSASFDPNDQVTTGTSLFLASQLGSNFFPGYIFEILSYGSALSDTDRGNVETYLKNKWGV